MGNVSIYWSEQTSMRTRMLLMLDWIKRGIFGRDLSKVSQGKLVTIQLADVIAISSSELEIIICP